MAEEGCVWRLKNEFEWEYWATTCDHEFILNDGTPKDNEMVYCPFCGKKLVVVGAKKWKLA